MKCSKCRHWVDAFNRCDFEIEDTKECLNCKHSAFVPNEVFQKFIDDMSELPDDEFKVVLEQIGSNFYNMKAKK